MPERSATLKELLGEKIFHINAIKFLHPDSEVVQLITNIPQRLERSVTG